MAIMQYCLTVSNGILYSWRKDKNASHKPGFLWHKRTVELQSVKSDMFHTSAWLQDRQSDRTA